MQVGEAQRPACANCGKPAVYVLGEGYPVCVDCHYKHESAQYMQAVKWAALMNQALEQMDALVPFGGPSPKLHIPRPPVPPINYNSPTVHVSGGTVGVINTGNVQEITVNLQSLAKSGAPEIAELLSNLTSAIMTANDADVRTKNELLELVADLTVHANCKTEDRKSGVVKAVFSAVASGAGAISSVAGAWAAVEPLLKRLFGY